MGKDGKATGQLITEVPPVLSGAGARQVMLEGFVSRPKIRPPDVAEELCVLLVGALLIGVLLVDVLLVCVLVIWLLDVGAVE